MCNQEASSPFTLKNKIRNLSPTPYSLSNDDSPHPPRPGPVYRPPPTCLSNLAYQRINSLFVTDPVTNRERWIFGNEAKYSKSLRLPLPLTFKACCSKKVNSLCTCCKATGGREPRGPPAFLRLQTPGPWYSGIYTTSPQVLTDKLIGVLGSTELLIAL